MHASRMSPLAKRLDIDATLNAIATAVAVAELPVACGCGCGTPLDDTFTSLDFASRACQALWSEHQDDPEVRATTRAAYARYYQATDGRTWPPQCDDEPWDRDRQLLDFRLLEATGVRDRALLGMPGFTRYRMAEAQQAAVTQAEEEAYERERSADPFLLSARCYAEDGEAVFPEPVRPAARRASWTMSTPLTWPGTAEEWYRLGHIAQGVWVGRNMPQEMAACREARLDRERARLIAGLASSMGVPPELLAEQQADTDETSAVTWATWATAEELAGARAVRITAHALLSDSDWQQRAYDQRETVAARLGLDAESTLTWVDSDGDVVALNYNPATGTWMSGDRELRIS